MLGLSTSNVVRSGGIAVPALIAVPVVMLAFVVGLSSVEYKDIRTRMQIEADAGALAGADSLAGDGLLRGRLGGGVNSSELYSLLQSSVVQIQTYAQYDPVYGNYAVPTWTPSDQSQGDIIFGMYDRTASPPFAPVAPQDGNGQPANDLQQINAVKVYMRRTLATNNAIPIPRMPLVGPGTADVITTATAMLDGDLQGFRPLFSDRAIPLAPIALDYTTLNKQTAMANDNAMYDPASQSFVPGSDGLPEITMTMASASPPAVSAVELNIGVSAADDVAAQITGGVYAAQLAGAPFGGAFLLQPVSPPVLSLAVPGQQYYAAADGSSLAAALNQVAQTPSMPRLWPIYNGFDGGNQPIIIAFIAARLASVQTTTDGMGQTNSITLTLQPSLVTEPSAVTNASYRGYVGVPSLTIAKLRLVP